MTDGTVPEQTPLEELTDLLKNQRRRWRRWFGGLLVLFLAIGFNQVRIQNVANDAKAAASTAQSAIEQVIAQRDEARKSACDADNTTYTALRVLASTSAESSLAFAVQLIGNRPIEGALADSFAKFNEDVVDPFRRLADSEVGPFKPRVCTAAGIKAYYEQGGDR